MLAEQLRALRQRLATASTAQDVAQTQQLGVTRESVQALNRLFRLMQELMADGINAEVIDLRTLRPLDKATVLESLKRTNRMVVVEEGWPTCSIASEIIAIAMTEGFDDLDAPVLRVTNVDVPMPYAANLEREALISAERIVAAARQVCYR